jgi:hypothetical protein
VINDRLVYWLRGGTEDVGPWLYYANSTGEWWVNTSTLSMENGAAEGQMSVKSDAMLPEEIDEGAMWQVKTRRSPTTIDWDDAPHVRARPCTTGDIQAWECSHEEDLARAREVVQGARAVMMTGQLQGDPQHGMMGIWHPMADPPGTDYGSRPVYWHRAGTEETGPWLYYAKSRQYWMVATEKKDMEAGRPAGFMRVKSGALRPEEITAGEQWMVVSPHKKEGAWVTGQVQVKTLPPRLFPTEGSVEEEAVLQRLAGVYTAGMVVWAAQDFNHNDEDAEDLERVTAGSKGTVVEVDEDGDITVNFEGHKEECWAFPSQGDLTVDTNQLQLQQFEVGLLPAGSFTALEVVRALVLERLRAVRKQFPAAMEDDLCAALVCYSPQSWLYAKGLSSEDSEDPFDAQQWQKYQGELHYGSDQAFHDGSAAVLGAEVSDDDAMAAIELEALEQGDAGDRYNLWYFRFCAAVEQNNYNEKGELRENASTHKPKVRAGARATADC